MTSMSAHESPEQTLARLDEIEARAAAAEPGPWGTREKGPSYVRLKRRHWLAGSNLSQRGLAIVFGDDDSNARFIAAAREDVPALLALLRALTGEVEQLRIEHEQLARWKAEQQQALIEAITVLTEFEGIRGPGLREACESAVARLREVEAERHKARADYQFMVERAADQHLDGYRELGARAAAAENQADELRLQLQVARSSWRCFHCGESFATEATAAEHFGPRTPARPAACAGMLQAISEEFERHGVHRNVHNAASVQMLASCSRALEAARWAARLAEEFPDAPSSGQGSESGDPLDVAIARVQSVVNEWIDLERVRTEELRRACDDIAALAALVREAIKRFWEPWARRFALTPSSRVPVAGRPRMQPTPGGWVERARAALSRLDQ